MNDKFDLDVIAEHQGVRMRPQIYVTGGDDSRVATEITLIAGGEVLASWQASDSDQ